MTQQEKEEFRQATLDALRWARQRAVKQLMHTHAKIGDYPDANFENVDPPYRHIRTLVGIIKDTTELIEKTN